MAEEWQDTGVDAGTEVEAAKAAALAAFMAAPVDSAIGAAPAVPPGISRTVWTATTKLSDGDVVKLKKVVNAAIMDATLKHIGPVSSDSSVQIDILEVGGIKKLNLRATGGYWEHVTADPDVTPGFDRPVFTIVWRDVGAPARPQSLWIKINTSVTAWEKLWPQPGDHKFAIDADDDAMGGANYAIFKLYAGDGLTLTEYTTGSYGQGLRYAADLSDLDPLPGAAEAEPGTSKKISRADHVHPLVRPTKIRYYLSDTHGTGYWTGHLLLTANPYPLEVNAIDLTDAASLAKFVSPTGSPGLATWQGGSVHAHLRIKLTGARVGRTYKLYTGNGDVVYTSLIYADHFSGDDNYQIAGSAPTQ